MKNLDEMSDAELQSYHDSLPDEPSPTLPAMQVSRAPGEAHPIELDHMTDAELQRHYDSLPDESATSTDALRGASQGATLGFSDEIVGAAHAAEHFMFNGLDASASAAVYTKVRDEERNLNNLAAKNSPVAYHGAEIAAGIAGSALMPGSAALAAGLKGAFGLGAATGVGYSESNTITGIGKDAAIGAAGGAVGHVVGGAIVNKLKGNPQAAQEAAHIARADNILGAIGINGEANMAKLGSIVQKKGISPEQYADDIASVVPFDETLVKMNPLQLQSRLETGKTELFKNVISPIHDKIDELTMGAAINVAEFKGKFIRQMKSELSATKPGDLPTSVNGIIEDLDLFAGGKPSASMAELENLKSDIAKRFLGSSSIDSEEVKGAAIRTITGLQKDQVSLMGGQVFDHNVAPGAKEYYKAAMRKYSNLEDTSSFMNASAIKYRAERQMYGDGNIDLTKKLRSAASQFAANRGVFTNAAVAVGELLKQKAGDPRFLKEAVKYNTVMSAFNNNPERYNRLASGVAAASLIGTGEVIKKLGYADSVITLQNEPIQPSFASIKENGTRILNILETDKPELYQPMKDALDNNDEGTLGGMIGAMKQIPAASKFFAPALGIDGKIYDEMDRIKCTQMVNNSGWSNTQRAQAHEMIKKYHQVPNFATPAAPPTMTQQVINRRTVDGKKEQKL